MIKNVESDFDLNHLPSKTKSKTTTRRNRRNINTHILFIVNTPPSP